MLVEYKRIAMLCIWVWGIGDTDVQTRRNIQIAKKAKQMIWGNFFFVCRFVEIWWFSLFTSNLQELILFWHAYNKARMNCRKFQTIILIQSTLLFSINSIWTMWGETTRKSNILTSIKPRNQHAYANLLIIVCQKW